MCKNCRDWNYYQCFIILKMFNEDGTLSLVGARDVNVAFVGF